MQNDRRRLWSTMLFVVLFGTFVLVFILSYLMGPKRWRKVAATQTASTTTATGGTEPAAHTLVTAGGRPDTSQLLAAGDGHELWVAQPVMGEGNIPGYELYQRSANTGTWHIAQRINGNGVQTFWPTQGLPRALALTLEPPGASTPYIMCDSTVSGMLDWVYACSLDGSEPKDPLPANHIIKAASGGRDQLFVITLGPPLPTTTRPGDPVQADMLAVSAATPPAATAPATTPASNPPSNPASTTASTTASAPATLPEMNVTTAPVPNLSTFNTYWYPPTPAGTTTAPADKLQPSPGNWCYLPPLGIPSKSGDSSSVPTASSIMALAEQNGQLIAMWVDPTRSGDLVVRTLNYTSKQAQWSAPIVTKLPEADSVPSTAPSRLFTVIVDKTLYVLWTVPTGNSIALHGGWMKSDAEGESRYKLTNMIDPMVLDSSVGQGINKNDLAVGASENSIVVVALNHENALQSMVFDNRGRPVSSAKAVVPESPRHDVQIGQNIAMILLVLMLTLSMWQWRQKPMPAKLPKGTVIAPIHLRALAFLIDAALPYAIVLLAFSEWESGGYTEVATRWMGLLARPEDISKSLDLLVFLGIYLGHVTIGEMFFRKSLGKALVGLQVLMVDGKSPTVAAILVRNLVRVPETAVGVALLYMLISEKRQRLGDLLGRTVVVSQEGTEVPTDVEKDESKKIKDKR